MSSATGADTSTGSRSADGPETHEDLVAVRRNVLLSGVVGGLGSLLGIAFLVRGSSAFDVLLGMFLLAVAALHLPTLTSSRVPVVVADQQGIRLRIGLTWRGLPWVAVRQVVVEHADSPLREGRLVVVPRDPTSTLDYLGPLAHLHLRWNTLWYGAQLAVPLGMTTVLDTPDLSADLVALASGRTEVVTLRGREFARLDDVGRGGSGSTGEGPDPLLVADEFAGELDAPLPPEEAAAETVEPVEELPPPVAALRELQQPTRVEVLLSGRPIPGQRVPGEVAQDLGEPVELVVDAAWVPAPAVPEPVIGPKIQHAREMLDMSIDELSQRTRIRPHVLEAMELDDFAPCGGDFYARGHLTAVARVLGLSLEPLVKTYDERYGQAPINARRVFEAELSTGLSGGMRATLGGPRWSLLIGSVLSLTMIWGLARLFAGPTEQLTAAPDPSSQAAGLAANRTPITSPLMRTTRMTVTAAHAGARVVVRDRTKRILWSGDLAIGQHRRIVGLAPFRVSADNAGAVEVVVRGKALGTVGTAGAPGAKNFG